jgi:hypothetical protein
MYEPLNTSQAKPRQTKDLTKGREFREAQVEVYGSVVPFLRLIASLGSVTNTLYSTWNYAYANDFEPRLKT